MKQRILCAVMAIALLLSLVPAKVSAQEIDTPDEVIFLEDGSYIEITIEENSARAVNTKSGSKTYTYRNGSDEILWKAKLSATFTYNGSSSTCSYGSCTVTISDNNWYEISNTTSRSSNTATTKLKMGEKFLGITISKPEFTITLSCDANGNLS